MGFKYTSLEDGQVVTSKEPRPDLDELARWVRSDAPDEPQQTGPIPSSPEPVAGPVNTDPVTGGEPPLLSVSAGVANPADTLTAEQAQQKAAEDLAAAGPTPEESTEEPAGQEPPSDPQSSDPQSSDPERPGLNGSTEDWAAYAKHVGVEGLSDTAGRDEIVAAYIDKFAPAGNASGKEWTDYAAEHGVKVEDGDGRDKVRAAVVEAGWAKA